MPEIRAGYFLPDMARKYERGASALVHVDRVSVDEAKARLEERDRREQSDHRTPAQRWLNEPPAGRSALSARYVRQVKPG